jgi:hypothetical protein
MTRQTKKNHTRPDRASTANRLRASVRGPKPEPEAGHSALRRHAHEGATGAQNRLAAYGDARVIGMGRRASVAGDHLQADLWDPGTWATQI